jgi:hypothetical protein
MKKYILSVLLSFGLFQAKAISENQFSNDSSSNPILESEADIFELIESQEIKYAYSMESNWEKGYYFSIDENGLLDHITPENPISEETWFLDEIFMDDSPELYYSEQKRLGGYLHQQLRNDRVKSITYFAGVDFVGAFVRFLSDSNTEQTIMYRLMLGESNQSPNKIKGYCQTTEEGAECFVEYSALTKKMGCSCEYYNLIVTRVE